jgi:hypothetical protein
VSCAPVEAASSATAVAGVISGVGYHQNALADAQTCACWTTPVRRWTTKLPDDDCAVMPECRGRGPAHGCLPSSWPANIEKLMKSTERVRDLGEVFTPSAMVEAMLDLLPASMWEVHPSATFLEPAAGDGNFLVAILARKLAAISTARAETGLPAGSDAAAVEFHALEALASIYGIDISTDNIVGDSAHHAVGARSRMLQVFSSWLSSETGTVLTSRSVITATATWVVERNLLVANMLPFEADGRAGRRDAIPLVEYRWQPATQTVEVLATTLGQAAASARPRTRQATLFDALDVPTPVWSGPARELRRASLPAPAAEGALRNGRG